MKLFDKIAIIGVGLIGGSLGMAIKKKGLAREVIGIVRRKKTIIEAIKRGAIDKGTRDLTAIKEADLIILATPVNTIINLLPKVTRLAKKGAIISDVGSTKEEIFKKVNNLFKKKSIDFVGTHPLAGIEKKGIIFAKSELFQGTLCILTCLKNTKPRTIKKLKRLWQKIGTRVIFLDPQEHDLILAFVSHLPHIAAFSLINTIPKEYFNFASTGLKDTTRIAASDPLIWRDICLTNRDALLKAIKEFQKTLEKFKYLIRKKNSKGLKDILEKAKLKRDGL